MLVVSGARQVGKSTLLGHQLPNWETVVFDPVVDVGNARSDPELFLRNHPPPLVLDEIRKLQSAMSRKAALYHWRLHGGSEIDLILERDGVLYPIEIKMASRPTRNDTRGFVSLRASYPRMRIAPGLVLAPAESLERLADDAVVAPYDMV